ncbi:hypothetical protein SCT_2069 [Sulfuricella sp. T08]|nr:hypothetical protein SCT_2069 [Sulfuricella sp. T08]
MSEVRILLIEGIFGMPSVFILGLIFIRLWRMAPPFLKAYRLRATLALLLIVACSVGVLGYVIIFAIEFYELRTCYGAGCAQGGLGTFIATPFAWLSLALTWAVSRTIFSSKFFPHLPE